MAGKKKAAPAGGIEFIGNTPVFSDSPGAIAARAGDEAVQRAVAATDRPYSEVNVIDLAKLPHIPLRSFTSVEGIQGISGQNTRTITRAGPGMHGLEIDLLPTIAHIWIRLPPIPGQGSGKLRERLVPCANVSASEPLR